MMRFGSAVLLRFSVQMIFEGIKVLFASFWIGTSVIQMIPQLPANLRSCSLASCCRIVDFPACRASVTITALNTEVIDRNFRSRYLLMYSITITMAKSKVNFIILCIYDFVKMGQDRLSRMLTKRNFLGLTIRILIGVHKRGRMLKGINHLISLLSYRKSAGKCLLDRAYCPDYFRHFPFDKVRRPYTFSDDPKHKMTFFNLYLSRESQFSAITLIYFENSQKFIKIRAPGDS